MLKPLGFKEDFRIKDSQVFIFHKLNRANLLKKLARFFFN